MEGEGVDQHRDEGPDFLGIPAPIAPPGDVGPDGADENAGREEEHGGMQQQAIEHGELFDAGGIGLSPRQPQRIATVETSEGKQRIGEHHNRDMQAEQRRTQHGHERRDLRIHVREVGHQQSEACNQQGKGEHEGETAHQGDAHAQHAHGHEEHGFKTVAHRHETRQIPPEGKPQCHANEGDDQCTTQCHVEPAAAKTAHQQPKRQKAQRETIHEGDFHGGDAIVDDFGRDPSV